MENKSHARYYQKLLHRCMVLKPKLTVLSTESITSFILRVCARSTIYHTHTHVIDSTAAAMCSHRNTQPQLSFFYARTYTQTTWVLDVSPGVGRTPGEPEESRSTKAQYTCRPYRCTQYICLYICWAAGFDDLR